MAKSNRFQRHHQEILVESARLDEATEVAIHHIAGSFREKAGYPLGYYREFRIRVRVAFAAAQAVRTATQPITQEAMPPGQLIQYQRGVNISAPRGRQRQGWNDSD